jgi:pantoate--beta-alanine ligase
MHLAPTIAELRAYRRSEVGMRRFVIVPTMGALHAGHVHLVRMAREMAGKDGRVGVSIFVNPLQFGPKEDFSRYPRTLDDDAEMCRVAGCDVLFAPSVEEVYAPDRSLMILEKTLSTVLCGESRPGHFDGVCTVVAKLFNLFQPDDAVFGKKDFQQLAIIRRMVRDLDIPVQIHGIDTVREADGLAMSSRNRYLSDKQREQAPALQQALKLARHAWLEGNHALRKLTAIATKELEDHAPLGRIDYLKIVDPHTLQPIASDAKEALMALAVHFGNARLIDNIELHLS